MSPSFAVGRAQPLLPGLRRLKRDGEIPGEVPIFLDSPMAAQATRPYQKHRKLLRIAHRASRLAPRTSRGG